MEPSLFIEYVNRYFPRLVLSITEQINGTEGNANPYYFNRFLTREWSLTGKWEALQRYNQRIMADVIAMDSSIPLKKRPSLAAASGEIPKIGMEMALNETDLTNLQMLAGMRNAPEDRIVEMLFQDTATCITGQYERIEGTFLQGLSSGVTTVTLTNNVGAEVRLDFQYLSGNQFQSTVPFSGAAATPLQDLVPMIRKAQADGNPIRTMLLDQTTLDQILASDDAKDIFAQANNVIGGVTFAPTLEQLNVAIRSKWGFVFEVVERTCRYQINGVDTDYQPWEAGQIIGINNNSLGSLVWSDVAEMNAPVAGVTYQRADQFILASKFRLNRPSLAEFTNSQARVAPVISATRQIYKLDSTATTTT